MLASTVRLGLFILLSLLVEVLEAHQPDVPTAGQYIDLKRRSRPVRNDTEWAEWANRQRNSVIAKYGVRPNEKRATGESLIVNQYFDSSFYGALAIGTPPTSFYVSLDTGSADLWVASMNCDLTCVGTGNFDSAKSSTFKNLDHDFSIIYGIGEATGRLVEDVVQMAGFTVANQQFGFVNSTSSHFLRTPVTGLIGLAWQSLSSSSAMPFWQTLASSGSWSSPLMAFQLTRYINASQADGLEPGGSLTMGYVNDSLYTGNIDFRDLPSGQPAYWLQEIKSMTVQGESIPLLNGPASYAAIDTGTTLMAGPASGVAAIYAQIPGSSPGTGQWEGFYSYPCSNEVTVEISFGGPSWAVSPADFQFQPAGSSDYCYGAFYSIPTVSDMPHWILGDTFLKNVYSVFRYDPPSVGFAALSETALGMNGIDALIPNATVGTSAASVTANAASMTARARSAAMLFVSVLSLVAFS